MMIPSRFYLTLPLLLILSMAPTTQAHSAPTPEQILNQSAGQQHQRKESGLMLDTSRRFYSVAVIKRFIDTLSASGGTFLHLHFSDNENYSLESAILNQRAENAKVSKYGTYINPQTNKPFLSYQQLDEIKAYAAAKNIELVPEIDSPGHMNGIFDLLELRHGKPYVASLQAPDQPEQLDVTNPEAVQLMESLVGEVADAFRGSSRHFHIGGDEFAYSAETNRHFIDYANRLNDFLTEKGLKTRIWNDGIINSTLDHLNRNIQVTYWSYDGDTPDRGTAQYRRDLRASMPKLIDKGFTVLNYNSYYLYVVPKEGSDNAHNSRYALQDLRNNWTLGVWDGQNQKNAVKDTDKIAGSALSIWGEYSGSLSGERIHGYTAELLSALMEKTQAAKRK